MLAGLISASLRVPPVSPFPTGKPDRALDLWAERLDNSTGLLSVRVSS
jgi:hypothetical protein